MQQLRARVNAVPPRVRAVLRCQPSDKLAPTDNKAQLFANFDPDQTPDPLSAALPWKSKKADENFGACACVRLRIIACILIGHIILCMQWNRMCGIPVKSRAGLAARADRMYNPAFGSMKESWSASMAVPCWAAPCLPPSLAHVPRAHVPRHCGTPSLPSAHPATHAVSFGVTSMQMCHAHAQGSLCPACLAARLPSH